MLPLAIPALLAGATPTISHAGDRGEFVFSAFTGMAFTQNDDLRVREPNGTDLTLHNVAFSGHDFDTPPYYGFRLTYFLPEQSHWGFGVEYFHAKVYLDTSDVVHVTGTRAGAPVDDHEPVNNTVQALVFHNGYNWVTADAFYRWLPGHRGQDFLGRFQPYVGAGVGAVIPFVQSQLPGRTFQEEGYELRGPGVMAMAGSNFDLSKHFSLFVEYKFTYADLGDININGGTVNLNPMSHHLVSGISVRF